MTFTQRHLPLGLDEWKVRNIKTSAKVRGLLQYKQLQQGTYTWCTDPTKLALTTFYTPSDRCLSQVTVHLAPGLILELKRLRGADLHPTATSLFFDNLISTSTSSANEHLNSIAASKLQLHTRSQVSSRYTNHVDQTPTSDLSLHPHPTLHHLVHPIPSSIPRRCHSRWRRILRDQATSFSREDRSSDRVQTT